jgi:hypothetical protein
VITKSIFIQQNINTVFTAFANLSNWQRLLDGVLNVQTLYNDGYHQEFLMTISRPLGVQTIRGFCFCLPNSRIEIFQVEPPSGFQRVTDILTFEEWKEGTKVSVERQFQLTTPASNTVEPNLVDTGYEEAKLELSGYLSKELNLLKTNLEASVRKNFA